MLRCPRLRVTTTANSPSLPPILRAFPPNKQNTCMPTDHFVGYSKYKQTHRRICSPEPNGSPKTSVPDNFGSDMSCLSSVGAFFGGWKLGFPQLGSVGFPALEPGFALALLASQLQGHGVGRQHLYFQGLASASQLPCGSYTKSISHHCETMGSHCLLVFTEKSFIPGFLRWCRILSIHSSFIQGWLLAH